LSKQKYKEALIFFSAGVGDALLLVPLVNELKKKHYNVTGVFTSQFNCESIFENTTLFHHTIIKKTNRSLMLHALLHYNKYDAVYVNHFAFSRINIFCAYLLAKVVYTNYSNPFFLQNKKSINVIAPTVNVHDALQNAFLFNSKLSLNDLDFNLNCQSRTKNTFNLPQHYSVVQVSSANSKAPYKNWKLENWLQVFSFLEKHYPHIAIVVLGDTSEMHLDEQLKSVNHSNITSLIGKTTLSDVVTIVEHSMFYLGLDSGLMHIAFALNKPTFTIWGASNKQLYGYEWKGKQHKAIQLNLPCSPCNAWIKPNTSRVTNPLSCPDFKCINSISAQDVIVELKRFVDALLE
jgi:ADP-heptose:LPS heptosyltransferase